MTSPLSKEQARELVAELERFASDEAIDTHFDAPGVESLDRLHTTRAALLSFIDSLIDALDRKPANCQHEPPYPHAETVLTSIRSPDLTAHLPNERCAIQEPHAVAECGEFVSDSPLDIAAIRARCEAFQEAAYEVGYQHADSKHTGTATYAAAEDARSEAEDALHSAAFRLIEERDDSNKLREAGLNTLLALGSENLRLESSLSTAIAERDKAKGRDCFCDGDCVDQLTAALSTSQERVRELGRVIEAAFRMSETKGLVDEKARREFRLAYDAILPTRDDVRGIMCEPIAYCPQCDMPEPEHKEWCAQFDVLSPNTQRER